MKKMKILWRVLLAIALSSCTNSNTNEKYDSTTFFLTDNYKVVKVDEGLKMAYLDLNPTGEKIILLLHGEPNYSLVYRNIAPNLCKKGYRVIVPDLIGFGNSSKPQNFNLITYSNHTKWLTEFISKLGLKNIHLFAHDWGAMISLRIIAEKPQLFDKVAISYGFLFDGTEKLPESFLGFRQYAKSDSSFSAGNIMDWGTYSKIPDSIKKKYDEPFKNPSDNYAVRKFPWLIPDNPNDKEGLINKRLTRKLRTYEKPFITIWGNHEDSLWEGKDSLLQNLIPGANKQEHFILESNHFIQEDQPQRLTNILLNFFNKK
ncbi:alpha/beta fold hydrolase [Algivirga pacifica]|uniref:Haloalkane dehalogenase n=1 Tax=Algivirga pacifica TaxID=1162670 RepID=A0ABP9D4U8_9BACT